MLTYSEFTNVVMRGVQKANRLTVTWSGGNVSAQDQAAEYLITVEVARELLGRQIKKDGGGFVLLEAKVKEILKFGPAKRGPREKQLRYHGRIDVALFDQSRNLVVLVEVKRMSGDVAGLRKDAMRLAAVMRRMGKRTGGSIRFGALAALRVVKDKDISKEASHIKNQVQKSLPDFVIRLPSPTRSPCKLDDGDDWHSHALCFTLHSK